MKKSYLVLKLCLVICLTLAIVLPAAPVRTIAASKVAILNSVTALTVKEPYKLWADRAVSWKTSSKKIATISSSGVVTGKKTGWVTITATDSSKNLVKLKLLILDTKGTVGSKKALQAALSSDEISQITLSSKKKTAYTIKEEDYSGKSLTINLPKGSVKNYSTFGMVTISAIGSKGYTAYANEEQISVLSNAKIIATTDSRVEFIDIESKKSSVVPQVDIVVDGDVHYVNLNSKAKVNITGGNEFAYLELTVNKKAKGSELNIDKQTDVKTYADAKLNFTKEAKNSIVYICEDSKPAIVNNTEDIIRTYDDEYNYLYDIDSLRDDEDDEDIIDEDNDISVSSEDDEDIIDDEEKDIYDEEWESGSMGNFPEDFEALSDADKKELILAKQIVDEYITTDMSEYKKLLILHDYLVEHVEYDGTYKTGKRDYKHPLQSGWAICGSYTQALNSMLTFAGLECEYVVGPITATGEYHAWTKVKVYGNWYNVDVTWDDSFFTAYEYFCISDKRMSQSRTWKYEKYHASATDLDAWDEFAQIKNLGPIPRFTTMEEITEYFYNKCSTPGTYSTIFRTAASLRLGHECDMFAAIRLEVFPESKRTTGFANEDEIYMIDVTTAMEFKPAAASSLVINLVTDEATGLAVIDKQVNETGDYVLTISEKDWMGRGFDVNTIFGPYAKANGYFVTSDYNIRGQVQKEYVWCTDGKCTIYRIPRNIMQVNSDDNEINEESLVAANITVVHTMEELEALVEPFFTRTDYWAYSLSVVPAWECSEADLLAVFQRIGALHGYTDVHINPGESIGAVRVSNSWYAYSLGGSVLSRNK